MVVSMGLIDIFTLKMQDTRCMFSSNGNGSSVHANLVKNICEFALIRIKVLMLRLLTTLRYNQALICDMGNLSTTHFTTMKECINL